MRNINVPVDDGRMEDMKIIQAYYSGRTGVKYSQAQTLRRLLYETANLIRNTGETYPLRSWELERQEDEMHRRYEEMQKGVVHEDK